MVSKISYTVSLLLLLVGGGTAIYFQYQDSTAVSAGMDAGHFTDQIPVPPKIESMVEVTDEQEFQSEAEIPTKLTPENAIVSRQESQPAQKKPELRLSGSLSISGMVMDESGRGVFGVPVTALVKNLLVEEGTSPLARTAPSMAMTDVDGFYEINGMADGEYRLRSEPDDRYEAAEAIVRAGADGADLILRERRPGLKVFGMVHGDGEALAGVKVVAAGQPSEAALTNEDGIFETVLQITAGKRNYTLQFTRDGYREKRSILTAADLVGPAPIWVDAELEPAQALVEVSGTVRDKKGEPVAGQAVQIYSEAARQRYTAISGRRGEIRFPEVETSDDYMVSVRPADVYRDYVALDVDIGIEGAELDIVLEPRSYGRLLGQMVNPDGLPVPTFSLWLRNPKALNQPPRLVTGDQQGFFEVDRIEAGSLVFETRGSPHVSISGIQLAPGETTDVLLVLDWGNHQLAGLVMDDMGRPVSASELFVTSVRDDGGLRSHVVRRAVTDETGFFVVGQIGSGYHTIRVDSPGFRPTVIDHEVGRDSPEVIIRLERAYSHGM